jgi:hypothetical protein
MVGVPGEVRERLFSGAFYESRVIRPEVLYAG